MIRGIRGAICVEANSSEAIESGAEEILLQMMSRNQLVADRISALLFTVTPDLDAGFPASATRKIGLSSVPALCSVEIDVANAMQKVLRVLILTDTELDQEQIKHVYIGRASQLRPDL